MNPFFTVRSSVHDKTEQGILLENCIALLLQLRPINRYEILNRYAFLVIFDDFPKKNTYTVYL